MPKKKLKINNLSSNKEVDGSQIYSLEEAIKAVNEEDVHLIKTIIEIQPEIINEKDEGEGSLLYYAVAKGSKEIAKLLLEKGASIESKDYFGNTPLHIAAYNVDIELVRFLVEKGANVKVVDDFSNTVLHSAAGGIINGKEKEGWEVVEYLLEKGVPTDVVAEGEMSVSDVFLSKDWSYAETYNKIKEEVKSGEAKVKRDKKEKLKEQIREILDHLIPEESSDNYEPIKSLLETIVANQKKLVENEDDSTTRMNLIATKEFAVSKNLEREKIEELCQKVAKLVEITVKKNRIEFIEEIGSSPWTIKFN